MASLSTAAGLRRLLAEALAADPARVLLGEEIARSGGAGGVTAGLVDDHPDQLIETSVADRGALGFAVGLALSGRKPVVAMSDSGRLAAGLEVLADAAAIALDGEFPVPLVVRVPAGGQAGPRVDRPMARALAAVPGLTVLCPGTAGGVLGAWQAALQARSPTVLLEARSLLTRRTEAPTPVQPGRLQPIAEGVHVTLVSWGSGVRAALDAREALANDGLSVEVLDLVSLAPLDGEALGARVRDTGRLVVVDAPEGPFAGPVLQAATDAAFLYLEAPPFAVSSDVGEIVRQTRATIHY